jgi:putative phage-type endonuclease
LIVQGSPEWFELRLGKVTASRVCDVIKKTQKGWGAERKNYAAQLICERLTGFPTETFQSPAMRWGTETEPQARAAYAFQYDAEVAEVGFISHPLIKMAGASPDGLVGEIGLLEIKCPTTATHLDTLEAKTFPADYHPQIQFQLAVTGRAWCDAASFDPRLPEPMQLFVERIERDEPYIAQLEEMVAEFLAEIDGRVSRLRDLYEQRAAA